MGQFQLGVIGAGNMAEAILRGGIAAKVLYQPQVVASDVSAARLDLLAKELGIAVTADNAVPAGCPRILLSVKPQMMGQVLDGIAPAVGANTLIITIAAGIRTEFIHQRLGGKGRIVRVMPNTPMLVGMGASALCKGPAAGDDEIAWAEKLFAACGTTVRVEEPMMDAVTAVSGSGPAYFFYLIEAMVQAGVEEGLDPKIALSLAVQTCRGAGEMLARTGESPEALRAKVTSPGGTTQAAITHKDSVGVKHALVTAIHHAAARSRELGK
jgi:pyrroline-5-carboxylate reductase